MWGVKKNNSLSAWAKFLTCWQLSDLFQSKVACHQHTALCWSLMRWHLQLVPSKPFSPASGNLVHKKSCFPLAVLFFYREEKRLNQNKKPNYLRLLVLVVSKQVLCRYSGSHPQPKDMCTRLVSSPQLSAGVSGSLINHTLALGATLPLPHVSWDSSPVDWPRFISKFILMNSAALLCKMPQLLC